MKITNLSDQPVTLRKNRKLADVSPCLAAEDFPVLQGTGKIKEVSSEIQATPNCALNLRLQNVGLSEIDIDLCKVTDASKEKLVRLLVNYNDVFSKHPLECGEVKEFEHHIRLRDERPFRLPYRRIPPAHYQKLRQVLTEMEEQGIIRKLVSEYASPLVLVWKKYGSYEDMNFNNLLCYLDDLLLFVPTEQEALSRLEMVFQRLRLHHLKLSPKKCNFLRDSVKFMGHIISGHGALWTSRRWMLYPKCPSCNLWRKMVALHQRKESSHF